MYSKRFEDAVRTMLEAHGLNRRKAGPGFQATHVLSVATIVSDYGFDEDVLIAAVLHDTLEDTHLPVEVIESRFGSRVLAIVQDVTEPPKQKNWRERKLAYIEGLRKSQRHESYAVAAADKIHNLSNMTQGLLEHGGSYMDVFSASPEEMVWYHETVLDTLRATWNHRILFEQRSRLDSFIDAIRRTGRATK